jgi:single-strand DNA-binding protein
LNIVVPYAFKSESGERLTGKSFHTVTLWGPMADVAGQFVRAGTQLFVSGRLQTDSWEDTESGEKRSKTKIVALDMIILDPKDGQMSAPEGASSLLTCLNRVQVIGNVTRDPEMRTTTNGQHVLTLGIATNERWRDRASGENKERTEFHSVVVWGELAEKLNTIAKKGTKLYISGRSQTRAWETQQGQKRTTTEIVAEQVSLLGVKNADIAAAIQTDAMLPRSKKEAMPTAEAMSEPMNVAAGIPDIKYESDIKPEDLPF